MEHRDIAFGFNSDFMAYDMQEGGRKQREVVWAVHLKILENLM